MKKIIKFLPAMAILLASGLAVATTSKVSTPNVKFESSTWSPLTGNYTCEDNDQTPCVGEAQFDAEGNIIHPVTNIRPGTYVAL